MHPNNANNINNTNNMCNTCNEYIASITSHTSKVCNASFLPSHLLVSRQSYIILLHKLSNNNVLAKITPSISHPYTSIIAFIVISSAYYRYLVYALTPRVHLDFLVYRNGASLVEHHQNLYQLHPILGSGHMWLPFLYPPIAAILMTPLTHISIEYGYTLFTVGNLITSILILWIVIPRLDTYKKLRSHLLSRPLGKINLIALWSFFCYIHQIIWPVNANLLWGQINLFLELCIVIDIWLMKNKPLQGVFTGIATAIKITPLGIIIFFMLTKQWRTFLTSIITCIFFTGLGWILDPADSINFFTHIAIAMEHSVGIRYGLNIGIEGVISRFIFSLTTIKIFWFIISFVVGVLSLITIYYLLAITEYTLAFIITLFTTLLISPISWTYHWTWVGIASVIVADFAYRHRLSLLMIGDAFYLLLFSCAIEWHFPLGKGHELHWLFYQKLAVMLYSVVTMIAICYIGFLSRQLFYKQIQISPHQNKCSLAFRSSNTQVN